MLKALVFSLAVAAVSVVAASAQDGVTTRRNDCDYTMQPGEHCPTAGELTALRDAQSARSAVAEYERQAAEKLLDDRTRTAEAEFEAVIRQKEAEQLQRQREYSQRVQAGREASSGYPASFDVLCPADKAPIRACLTQRGCSLGSRIGDLSNLPGGCYWDCGIDTALRHRGSGC